MPVLHKAMHRQKFNGSNPETLQILNHRGGRQSGISAAQVRQNIRMVLSEAFDMHFVENTFVPGDSRGLIRSPRERRINNRALHHPSCTVTAIKG